MSQVTIDLVIIQFSNACHELWTRNNRSQFVGIIFTPSNGSLDWKSHTQLHQSATWSTLTKTELNSWLDRIASMQRCSHTSVDLSFDSILSISILVSTTVPHSNTARCSFIQNQFKQKNTRQAHTHTHVNESNTSISCIYLVKFTLKLSVCIYLYWVDCFTSRENDL